MSQPAYSVYPASCGNHLPPTENLRQLCLVTAGVSATLHSRASRRQGAASVRYNGCLHGPFLLQLASRGTCFSSACSCISRIKKHNRSCFLFFHALRIYCPASATLLRGSCTNRLPRENYACHMHIASLRTHSGHRNLQLCWEKLKGSLYGTKFQ